MGFPGANNRRPTKRISLLHPLVGSQDGGRIGLRGDGQRRGPGLGAAEPGPGIAQRLKLGLQLDATRELKQIGRVIFRGDVADIVATIRKNLVEEGLLQGLGRPDLRLQIGDFVVQRQDFILVQFHPKAGAWNGVGA